MTKRQNGHAKRKSNRRQNGRFAEGNPGGPGRPRRLVEREYLACLSDRVSLADWGAIVDRAVKDAKAGNARAREWLTRYLLGEPTTQSLTLTELVTREALGVEVENEIAAEADQVEHPGDAESLTRAFSPTVLDRALRLGIKALEARARERVEGEPALQPHRDMLYRGVDWNFDDVAGYWRWVATAPIGALVEWAEENLDGEPAAERDANGGE